MEAQSSCDSVRAYLDTSDNVGLAHSRVAEVSRSFGAQ